MEDREEPPDEKSNAQGRYISAILCAIFPGDSPLIESLKLEEMKSEPCLKGEPVHKKRFNTFYCTTLQQAARYAGKYDSISGESPGKIAQSIAEIYLPWALLFSSGGSSRSSILNLLRNKLYNSF